MQGVAIDVETTGLKWGVHDIIEIAVVAHDENFMPTGLRFVSRIRPTRPALADQRALEVNNIDMDSLMRAPTVAQVRGMLIEWKSEIFEDEPLLPLGHNYPGFDMPFMKVWLGDVYSQLFHYKSRCSWQLADICRTLGMIQSDRLNLETLVSIFNIKMAGEAHSALSDSLAALDVYRKCINLLRDGCKTAQV